MLRPRIFLIFLLFFFNGIFLNGEETARDTIPEASTTGVRVTVSSDTIPSGNLETTGNVAEALKMSSGLQVRDYGGIGGLKTVNVRSLGSEYTAVFIDGVQVGDAQNAQVDLGRFSTFGLGSLRIVNGGSSALHTAMEYGAAGSVHLDYSRPEFTDGRKSAYEARIRAGSSGLFSPALSAGFKVSEYISASLDASYLTSNGKYRYHAWNYLDGNGYDTVMTRKNGDISSVTMNARVYGGKTGRWEALTSYYDSERGLPGAVVRMAEGYPLSRDRQADRDFMVQGSWTGNAGRATLMFKGKFADSHLKYSDFSEEDTSLEPDRWKYHEKTAYTSAAVLLPVSGWLRLKAAADFLYNTLDANAVSFVHPERYTTFTAVSADAGARDFSVCASLLWTSAADRFSGEDSSGFGRKDRTRNNFSPSIMMTWSPAQGLSVEAFAKDSYRLPTFNDLYYTTTGASDLKPEKASQYDLGLSWNNGDKKWMKIFLSAETYYEKVKEKLVAVPTYSQFRWSMMNIGETEIYGLEAKGRLRHESAVSWELSAQYTFQRAKDLSLKGDVSYGGQVAYIPWSSGSVSADISWKGWKAEWNLIWNGRRYSSSANLPEYRLEGWNSHDLWLTKGFSLNGTAYDISLGIRNLSGEKYSIVPGFPMPGRQIAVNVGMKF